MDNFWLKAEQSALKNLYKKSNKKLNSIAHVTTNTRTAKVIETKTDMPHKLGHV